MFYKIIQNNEIIDVISNPRYVKFSPSVKRVLGCPLDSAEGLVSSNGEKIWHIPGKKRIPRSYVEDVEIYEIGAYEYDLLKNNDEPEKVSEKTGLIIADSLTLNKVRTRKIQQMSQQCHNMINRGFDIKLNGKIYHYSLTTEDQINMLLIWRNLDCGFDSAIYHADGEECRFYSKEELLTILFEAEKHKNYHITYFNALKRYINYINDIQIISNLVYGEHIPEEYQTEAFKSLNK